MKMVRFWRQLLYSRWDRSQRTRFWIVVAFVLGHLTHYIPRRSQNATIDPQPNTAIEIKDTSFDTFLVILIFSSVSNFNRRQAIRETWTSELNDRKDVLYYFVISGSNINTELEVLLEDEQIKYKDLLIFKNLEDSFYLLTQKLLVSFGWLTDIPVLNELGESLTPKPFGNFKYVMKCDDDSFARVNDIMNILKTDFTGKKGENLYWGFFDGRAKAKKTGKYKEEDWDICDYYLPYALGGGYVVAERLVRFVASNADMVRKYKSEDTSLGAWLSIFSDVKRVHDARFDTEYISRGCHQTYLITHKHSESAMQTFHSNLKSTGLPCQKEFRTRLSYEYDWKAPPSKCCARKNSNIP